MHRTFSWWKKERQNLQGLPGFLGKKKRTFGSIFSLFHHFFTPIFDGFDLIQLMTVIWTLKTWFWAKIDEKSSKNSKKWPKNRSKVTFFQVSRVPPLQNAKKPFSNMKSPLKMAKTSGSFDDFDDFFIFWPKNHQKHHFWPQNIKNPEEKLENGSKRCHNPAPTTTLCLAMFVVWFLLVSSEMATSFSTKTNMKST